MLTVPRKAWLWAAAMPVLEAAPHVALLVMNHVMMSSAGAATPARVLGAAVPTRCAIGGILRQPTELEEQRWVAALQLETLVRVQVAACEAYAWWWLMVLMMPTEAAHLAALP